MTGTSDARSSAAKNHDPVQGIRDALTMLFQDGWAAVAREQIVYAALRDLKQIERDLRG